MRIARIASLFLAVAVPCAVFAQESKKARPQPLTTVSTIVGSAPSLTVDLGKNVKLELVRINAGSFRMGSGKLDLEKPVHQVTIAKPFYLGKYEVTQGQWQSLMANNPSNFMNCDNCPVEQVSWNDTQQFLAKLNERNDGFHYKLPSEAEWEYACRAGTTVDYARDFDSMAWYDENSGDKTHPVGTKQPNAWGLYDMLGNVLEWCQDWYHDNYIGSPVDGSAWESGGGQTYRVMRGGSWVSYASEGSFRGRNGNYPDSRHSNFGFRVVAVPVVSASQLAETKIRAVGARAFRLTVEMKGQLASEMVKNAYNPEYFKNCMDEAGGIDRIVDIKARRLSNSGQQYLLTGKADTSTCAFGARTPMHWIYEYRDGNFRMLADIGACDSLQVTLRRTNGYLDIKIGVYLNGYRRTDYVVFKYNGTTYECRNCGRD